MCDGLKLDEAVGAVCARAEIERKLSADSSFTGWTTAHADLLSSVTARLQSLAVTGGVANAAISADSYVQTDGEVVQGTAKAGYKATYRGKGTNNFISNVTIPSLSGGVFNGIMQTYGRVSNSKYVTKDLTPTNSLGQALLHVNHPPYWVVPSAPTIACETAVTFSPGVKLTVPVTVTSETEASVSVKNLPDGLKYYSSGKIYGTPKACSKAVTVTVTAKNDAGTTTKKIVFTPVNPGFAVSATVPSADGGTPTAVASKGKVRPYLGVNFEMTLAATPNVSGSSYAVNKITVSGLKNGLSFDSKTGKITGVPTKTGRQTVKATFTNKWGWSTTFPFYIYPKALPTWLVGNYNGCGNYGSSYGTSKLSVGSTGKLSGKIIANGSSYSFSVSSFLSCTNAADGAEIFTARAKVNKKYYALFTFAPATFGDDKTLVGTVVAESEKAGKAALEAYRDAWAVKDLVSVYKSTTLRLTDEQLASYGTGLKAGDALKISLRSKKPGTATITGALAGKAVSVSVPVIVTALETDAGVDGTTTTAFGEIVVPYGKKTLVLPLTWTADTKLAPRVFED